MIKTFFSVVCTARIITFLHSLHVSQTVHKKTNTHTHILVTYLFYFGANRLYSKRINFFWRKWVTPEIIEPFSFLV